MNLAIVANTFISTEAQQEMYRRRRPPARERDRLQFGAELSRNDLGQLQLALYVLLKIDASQQINKDLAHEWI